MVIGGFLGTWWLFASTRPVRYPSIYIWREVMYRMVAL